MPVFTDALLADTLDLTTEEFGAYCLILFMTWEKGNRPFPDDDRILSRITRVPLRQWRQSTRSRLIQFFDITSGFWVQKRLAKEWLYTLRNRAQKSSAGKASAEAKKLKSLETDPTAVPTERSTAVQRQVNSSTSTSTSTSQEEVPTTTGSLLGETEDRNLSHSVDDDFEVWWTFVPKKTAKEGARKAYRSARKKVSADALLAAMQAFARANESTEKKYIAGPLPWLNQGRWLDELPTVVASQTQAAIDASEVERLARIERIKAKYPRGVKNG